MFTIGLIWAAYEKRINKILTEYRVPLLILSVIVFILLYRFHPVFQLMELAYLLLIVFFFRNFEYKNRFLSFTGKISLEIYLLHGLAIRSFRYFVSEEVAFLPVLLLTVFIVLSSWFLNLVLKRLYKLIS